MDTATRPPAMTEDEWYALGNPHGSFDVVLDMAEENSRAIRRANLAPHPWDTFDEKLAERHIPGRPT